MADRPGCPVCNLPAGNSGQETPAFRQCARCHLIFRQRVSYPAPGEGWDTEYWRDEGVMDMHLRRVSAFTEIVNVGRALVGHEGRWLDVGCGVGALLGVAAGRGWQVAGLEPAASAVGAARRRLPYAEIVSGSVEEGLEHFGAFDIISITDVLRCVINPVAALESCAAHLAPSGWLLVRECDARWRKRARARQDPDSPLRPFDYAQEFTPASMAYLLGAAGLASPACQPSPLFWDSSDSAKTVRSVVARAWYPIARRVHQLSGGRAIVTPNFLAVGQRAPS